MEDGKLPMASQEPVRTTLDGFQESRVFLDSLVEKPFELPYDLAFLPELLLAMTDNEAYSGKLAQVVSKSQGLTAKVLSVANSACYGLQYSVDSLDRAIQVLGMLELHSLVVLFSASAALSSPDLPPDFPTKNLWEHQLETAHIGRELVIWLKSINYKPALGIDEKIIHTAGILHDVGKLTLALREPEVWRYVTNMTHAKNINFNVAENEYWGIDHGSIGSIILSSWGLPEVLCEIVSWHHHPKLATKYITEVNLLAAANAIAVDGLEGGKIPERALKCLKDLPEEFHRPSREFLDKTTLERCKAAVARVA